MFLTCLLNSGPPALKLLRKLTNNEDNYTGGGGRGGTWVNFCWVCAASLPEPLLNYRLFCGQL